MPKQITLQGVHIGFDRHEIDGEAGWIQTIADPHSGEVILIPFTEELKDSIVRQLTGVEVVTDAPPSLLAKMAAERRS